MTRWKFSIDVFYAALGFVLLVAGFGFGYFTHGLDVQVKTHTIAKVPSSYKGVEQAWGKPNQVVSGAAVGQGAAQATCDVYQSKQAIICH